MAEQDHRDASQGAHRRARPARRSLPARVLRGAGFLLVGLVLLAGAAAARLAVGPIVLPDPVKTRIEAALDGAMQMNALSLGEIALSLDDTRNVQLDLSDITLTDPDGAIRAAFPALRVSLAPRALAQGQVRPTRIELADAGLRLSRDADGQLDLQLTTEGATLSLEDTLERIDVMFAASEFVDLQSISGTGLNVAMADQMTGQVMRVRDADMRLERKNGAITLLVGGGLEGTRDARLDLAVTRNAPLQRTDVGLTFSNLAARDLATASPALAWLDLLRAPISGRLVTRLDDDGSVGDLSGSFEIGAGQLSVEGADGPLGIERMTADFLYEADRQRMRFDAFEVVAPELSFTAEGHADVAPDGTVFVGQFRLAGIEAAPRGLFEAPLILEQAAIDLRLTLAPTLLVEIGQAVVVDDGLVAHARATIDSQPEGLRVAVDARIAEVDIDTALAYWPVAAAPGTRRWIVENVDAADLRGIDFAWRSSPGAVPDVALDFDFEAAAFRPLRVLDPIEAGAGYFSLRGPQMVVRIDAGDLPVPGGGSIALGGSHVVVPTTRMRNPSAEIELALAGRLSDILLQATRPPLNLFADGAMTIDRLGDGAARLRARIDTRFERNLPLSEIGFVVEGVVRDYASATLLPGRTLTARELRLNILPDEVTVSGQARLDGVRMSGQWSRALGPETDPASQIVARVTVDRAALDSLGVRLPDGMMSGQGLANLTVDLAPQTPPILRVASDLRGIGLSVPQLGWRLPQDRAGDLQATVRLGPDPDVTALSLEGAGLSLTGRVDLGGSGFERLVAERLRIGGWLDVAGRLTSRGQGAAPALSVTGGSVDLRGLPQGAGGGASGRGGPITATLDRLQVTESIALTGVTADLSGAGGLSGQFAGRVNGGAAVTGTLNTVEAGPAVRIVATDGGAVLRSAGLIRNIHGGAMELIIAATGRQGTYDGQLTIDSPRLRDAPAMAELLNLISVVGLLEQLGGEGINLGDVYARFVISPNQIRVTRGDAVGPSIGLSMDGAYDIRQRSFDMQGVISPLYIVNGFFGAFLAPRREGLFGFSYTLTGTPEQTRVSVNPLSILTPGIFREIFRRPPPEPLDPP